MMTMSDWQTFLLVYGIGVFIALVYSYWPMLFGPEERREATWEQLQSITRARILTDDAVIIHTMLVIVALLWPLDLVVWVLSHIFGQEWKR